MGGCQNYGPFLGTLNIRCRIMIGIQKWDHNFDNHQYYLKFQQLVGGKDGGMAETAGFGVCGDGGMDPCSKV